jgi:hypothetical protein
MAGAVEKRKNTLAKKAEAKATAPPPDLTPKPLKPGKPKTGVPTEWIAPSFHQGSPMPPPAPQGYAPAPVPGEPLPLPQYQQYNPYHDYHHPPPPPHHPSMM